VNVGETWISRRNARWGGTAGAQTVTTPSVGGATVTPPSVGSGSVQTPPATPPSASTPAMPSRSVGAGGASVSTPSVSGGTVAPPSAGSATVNTPGANPPSVTAPGVNSRTIAAPSTANAPPLPNAKGSAGAAAKIQADGYKNVQGLTRGADGKWHGKAMRGNTQVDVSVDARGNVSSQ
jgi:hypothetical protein